MSTFATDFTKERLLGEFDAAAGKTEQVVHSVANASATKLAGLRDEAIDRANAAAKATNEYVHGSPWQALGASVAIAAGAGLIIGLLMSRR